MIGWIEVDNVSSGIQWVRIHIYLYSLFGRLRLVHFGELTLTGLDNAHDYTEKTKG